MLTEQNIIQRTKYRAVLLILSMLCLSSIEARSYNLDTLKIACIGNSITLGSGVVNPDKNAYPAQLQNVLGSGYEVMNFGVSGATLLNKGDNPYTQTKAFRSALEYKADLIFIKLGTNDSKLQNRKFLNAFESDYKALIQEFKKNNSAARVILLLPIPSFSEDNTGIFNPVILNDIIPKIKNVAFETDSELIDLYQLFVNQPQLLPDKIHPSSLGTSLITSRIFEYLKQEKDYEFDLMKNSGIDNGKTENFHGYELVNFEVAGVRCKVVRPKFAHEQKQWIWRARFWGHEPQTDIALLERGFHVVYCDVADLYGSTEAVARWNSFYAFLVNGGLAKKTVLEGMSRGGLIVYNWALENPEKVACIYADAPVLNAKSWPGGYGRSKGFAEGWELFKQLYALDTNTAIADFKGDPINRTAEITAAKIPMIHVVGLTDQVVPVAENTELFEKNIKAHGGDVKVIYKKDNGHHPHSLKNPSPIVNFILRATGAKLNDAIYPGPGSEYRSSAGWVEGTDWWAQMEDINQRCEEAKDLDLLLIGNSITQGWGGNRTLLTYEPGKEAAKKYFEGLEWINAGISGDHTQHVMWRVKNGSYAKANPKFVVLTIGVNNFGSNSAAEISEAIGVLVDLLETEFPTSQIVLFGPLPAGIKPHSEFRKKYRAVHQSIAKLGDRKNVNYIELLSSFSDNDGMLKQDLVRSDGVHIRPEGFMVWAKAIREKIDVIHTK